MTRNLEERMAEISRRSEAIFRRRKQRRNRVLAVCVPLVLLLGISAAFLRQHPLPKKPKPDGWYGPHQTVFVGSVTVQGKGVSHRYTSEEDVTRITDLIGDICSVVHKSDGESTEPSDPFQDYYSSEQSSAVKYTILVTEADGTVTEFSLLPELLVNRQTGKRFPLNSQTYQTLKAALGIQEG